ncbi:MAG: hypothetical protein WC611_06590, partial [Candidatus Neomarinimicrobiota bacterium]
ENPLLRSILIFSGDWVCTGRRIVTEKKNDTKNAPKYDSGHFIFEILNQVNRGFRDYQLS